MPFADIGIDLYQSISRSLTELMRKRFNDQESQMAAFLTHICHPIYDLIADLERALLLARRFDVLSHMTDDQLAARGLKREQIPQFVFEGR